MTARAAAVLLAVISLNVGDVATKVQETYEKAQSYRAHFVQEATLKTIDQVQKDEGTVYFKKPGKMRWEYKKSADQPLLQLIVSDGETLWVYMPADKQVMVDRVNRIFPSKTPMNFLAGMGNLTEEFDVSFAKDKGLVDPDKEFLLSLKEKKPSETAPAKLLVAVSKDTYRVDQAIIFDKFGNRNRITFDSVEINTTLPDSLFSFTIPKGVEVIRPPAK